MHAHREHACIYQLASLLQGRGYCGSELVLFEVYQLDVPHRVLQAPAPQLILSVYYIPGLVIGHRSNEMSQVIEPNRSEMHAWRSEGNRYLELKPWHLNSYMC
jgi:hypothetical protein